MAKHSEFGRGLAICIVKFAEHFENDWAQQIADANWFYSKTGGCGDHEKLQQYDIRVRRNVELFDKVYLEVHGSVKEGLSSLISAWASGATDHLYDIQVPPGISGRTKLARMIIRLKDRGLTIGHGFTDTIWKYEDMTELEQLTEDIALEVDKVLGLKPDSGDF